MTTKKPWEFHPDLTEGKITAVTRLITQAYVESQDYMIPEKGDNRNVHGLRRYYWARRNLTDAAGTVEYPYLSILADQRFTFMLKIGDVPLRFKRAPLEKIHYSVFKQYEIETAQLSLLSFLDQPDPCELGWRIIVEDDFMGDVVRVAFVGADAAGNIKCFWEMPGSKFTPKIVPIPNNEEKGKDLKPATVQLKSQAPINKEVK